jgi:hypothetical protein
VSVAVFVTVAVQNAVIRDVTNTLYVYMYGVDLKNIIISRESEEACCSLKAFSKALPVNVFAGSKRTIADIPVEEIRTAFLKKAHRVTQFCCAHQPGWP